MDLARFCSSARVMIVAGKGGVGKTTVTATLAAAAADAGLSVLIVEVEGKSGLAACFGRPPLGYEEAELATRIRGRTLTPDEALVDYLENHGLRRISKRLVASVGLARGRVLGGPGDEGHPRPRQGEGARARARRGSDHYRRPRGRPCSHLSHVAAWSRRRCAGRAGEQAVDRRDRDALGPGALPGDAGDRPGGDTGERARRHRIPARGPQRRAAGAGRRERVLPRPRPARVGGGGLAARRRARRLRVATRSHRPRRRGRVPP